MSPAKELFLKSLCVRDSTQSLHFIADAWVTWQGRGLASRNWVIPGHQPARRWGPQSKTQQPDWTWGKIIPGPPGKGSTWPIPCVLVPGQSTQLGCTGYLTYTIMRQYIRAVLRLVVLWWSLYLWGVDSKTYDTEIFGWSSPFYKMACSICI